MRYEKIFSPVQIGGLTLKNRIAMAAMHDGLGQTGGDVSRRQIEYYAARAKGGVGLIINGFTVVCPDNLAGTACAGQTHLTTLDNRNAIQYFAERIHEYDCRLFIQLHHPGRSVYNPARLNHGQQPVSCTSLPQSMKNDPTAAPVHELTAAEIKEIENCFAQAAADAFMAGADGVEVHCAHGYLLSQFITPSKNDRTDAYGGNLENNCRIATEILDLIRSRVPKQFPISCRINGIEADFRPSGKEFDMEYMRGVAKLLEAHGASVINVSMGGLDCITSAEVKAGSRDDIIKNIKDAVSIPVMAVNVLKTPEEAERMLAEGIADIAMLGRELIAEPDWVEKAKSGCEEDIRPCLSCNNCILQSAIHAPVRCSINPLAGREVDDNALKPGNGNVLVIGAGPAGIQAALTSAEKGYQVTLLEKGSRIGGSLNLADKAPGKFRMDILMDYYARQIEKNDRIHLKLNCELTASTLAEYEALDPAYVVLSAGGTPVIPPFEGSGLACTAESVLAGETDIKKQRVVIIGGGMTGLETAELLATKENRIVIAEMLPSIGFGTFPLSTIKAKLALARSGVAMKASTLITGIQQGADGGCVRVAFRDLKTGLDGYLPCDRAVLALGVKPEQSLYAVLREKFRHVVNIGDSSKAGKIVSAVSDGYHKIKHL